MLTAAQRALADSGYALALHCGRKHLPWARASLPWLSPEDVCCCVDDFAIDALLDAARAWDGRGLFAGFVALCVGRRVRNSVRNEWIRYRHDLARVEVNDDLDSSTSAANPCDVLLAEEALASLPGRQQVIVRRLLEGYSQDEIAKELGISQMHVSRRLETARVLMRAWLRGEEAMTVDTTALLAVHLERMLPARFAVRALNAATITVSDGDHEAHVSVTLPADVAEVVTEVRRAFGLSVREC